MNVCTVLDEIERLAGGMVNLPQFEQTERVRDYVTIRVLIQELDDLHTTGSRSQNPNDRLQQLKQYCRILAGISDETSTTDKQAYSQAREILNALRTQFRCNKTQ